MQKQLFLGTRNPARIQMLRSILQDTGVKIITLDALGIEHEVEEDGQTTQLNAEKKARGYYALSGIPTLAMDGGLHIDRFSPEKQPGVMVKRIHADGSPATDAEMIEYYLRELWLVGGESLGTWTGSQALAVSPDSVITSTFSFVVRFTTARKGALAPGRVLDSMMIDPQSGKYYMEMALEERPYYTATREFILSHVSHL